MVPFWSLFKLNVSIIMATIPLMQMGVNWEGFEGFFYSLKRSEMKVRPSV